MKDKQVALELAEFLEASAARELVGVPRDATRKIAAAFLELSYGELGKAPRFLDADDLRALVVERMPSRFARRDADVEHAPVVLAAFLEHLTATSVTSQAFELRRALGAAAEELVAIVASGRNVPEAPAKQDPFVHGAAKLGRNDPCSCGSGKKFKKCHGKEA